MSTGKELTEATLLSLLPSVMAFKGLCSDCNDATSTGFYRCDVRTPNAPIETIGFLVTLNVNLINGEKIAAQIYISNLNKLYMRNSWAAGAWTWKPWREFAAV